MKRWTALAIGALIIIGTSACGKATVSAADVEQQVTEQLTAQVGQAPDSVSCPGDLPAEVGATLTCELVAGSDTLPVTVTVTSVDGSKAAFDIEVGGA